MKKIGIFVGSLRKDSFSKKIAQNLISLAPDGFNFQIISIGELPLYNQDYDSADTPESYAGFRKQVQELDGFIFITPEYNRSVPAALKNALDVASRPWGQNVWSGKPGAVISTSIGGIGGFGANHHLRQSLSFLNVLTMQQPEVYLGGLNLESFDENGTFKSADTVGFIQNFVEAYVAWFNQLAK